MPGLADSLRQPDEQLQPAQSPQPEPVPSGLAASLRAEDDIVPRLQTAHQLQQAPERATRVLDLVGKTGMPVQFIDENLDEVEQASRQKEFNAEAYRKNHPGLAAWMAKNPSHYAFAMKDRGFFENISYAVQTAGEGWDKANDQDELARLSYHQFLGNDLTPQQQARKDFLKKRMQDEARAGMGDSKLSYITRQVAYGAGQSFLNPTNLQRTGKAAVAGGAAGAALGAAGAGVGAVPGAVAGAMAGIATNDINQAFWMETGLAFDEFSEMKDQDGKPMDPVAARAAAGGVGAINALIEVAGDAMFLKLIPGAKALVDKAGGGSARAAVMAQVREALASPTRRGVILNALKKIGGAGSVEGITEFMQEMVGAAGREAGQALSGQDFAPDSFQQDLAQAGQVGWDTFVGQVFGMGLIPGSMQAMEDASRVKQAKRTEQLYEALAQGAESEAFKALPQAAQDAVKAVTGGTRLEQAYMDPATWNDYWTGKGVDPREVAAEVLGDGGEAYDEAVKAGVEFAIPTDRYARKLATTEHHKFLGRELRYTDEMNLREADEALTKADADALAAGPAEMPQAMDGPAQVGEVVKEMLLQAGEDRARAEKQAKLWESRYRARIERRGETGVSAAELMRRWPLRIQREGVDLSFDPMALEAELEADRKAAEADKQAWIDSGAADLEEMQNLARAGGLTPVTDAVRRLGGLGAELMKAQGDRGEVVDLNHVFQKEGLSLDRMVEAINAEVALQGISTPADLAAALEAENKALQNYKHAKGKGSSRMGEAAYKKLRVMTAKYRELGQAAFEQNKSVAETATGDILKLRADVVPSLEEWNRTLARLQSLEKELRTDHLTGLRSEVAYKEDEALGWPLVSSIDVDGLGRMNDFFGHEAGNALLKGAGAILSKAEGDGEAVRFYRLHGDEMAARFKDAATAEAFMARLQMELEGVKLELVKKVEGAETTWDYQGIGLSYGIGENDEAADAQLYDQKQQREAAGLRQRKTDAPGAPRRAIQRAAAGAEGSLQGGPGEDVPGGPGGEQAAAQLSPFARAAQKGVRLEQAGRAQTDLRLGEVGPFKTGQPVTFQFRRNPEKSPNMGARFGQDIEPAGRYMVEKEGKAADPEGFESGTISFKNPLVLEWTGYDEDGWKARLSKAYGGLKGKALSKALLADGYDGVVTMTPEQGPGRPAHTDEIVDLTVVGKPAVKRGGQEQPELLVQHNLSTSKLRHAAKMGGLAVPSLAVTKVGSPLDSFGDITLLGDPGMADPKQGNQVYGADVYSPRYPTVVYHFETKVLRKAEKEWMPWMNKLDEKSYFFAGDNLNEGPRVFENSKMVMARFLEERGIDYKLKGEDYTWGTQLRRAIEGAGLGAEFADYAYEKFDELHPEEKLFKGYTYSGNRRYAPHTLENVVKELKKNIRGGEGFNYGVGSLRAMFTPKFRNLDQVRKEKGRLVTSEQFTKVKEDVDAEFWALAEKLKPYYQGGAGFGYGDAVISTLQDVAKIGMNGALESVFKDVPTEVKQDIADYLNSLRKLPTEYFEVKVPRAVGLNEFKVAVVPDSAGKDALKILNDAGMKVYTYTKGKTEDETKQARQAAIAQASSENRILFQDPRRGKDARGSITINDAETLINLARTGDATTFLHESWHRWFFEMAQDVDYVREQAYQKASERLGIPVEAVREIATAKPEQMVARYKAALEVPNNGEAPADFKRYPLGSVAMMDFGGDYENRYVEVLQEFNPSDLVTSEAEQGIKNHPSYARYVEWSKQGIEPPYISVAQTESGALVSSNRRRTLVAQELGTPIKGWFGPHNKETGLPLKYGDVLKAVRESASPVQQKLVDDFNVLLKHVGAKDWASMTESQQEQLAKYGEAYLLEGKAPSAELRSVMQSFRAWMVHVYTTMKALLQGKAPINPEVSGVLDRMLATDAEIAQAEAEVVAAPLPGLEQDPAYAQALADAHEAAVTQLSTQALAELARERTAMWKEERDKLIRESIAMHGQEPVYRALALLQHGTMPDGSPLPDGTPAFKLSKESIVERFSSLRLPKVRPYVYSVDGGVDVETAAELFGFSSADEMLNALDEAKPLRALASEEADAEMKVRHGDMMLDGTMTEKAREAVRNDKMDRVHALEWDYLAGQAKAAHKGVLRAVFRRPAPEVVKAQAEAIVARRAVKDIRPITYQRAQARAAKEKLDLALKGDFQGALAAKQREVLNAALYRAAVDARAQVDGLVDYMRKFQKPSTRERLGKAGGDYLEQIDALAQRYSFAPVSLKALARRASLREFAAKMEAEGTPVEIPEQVLNDARQVSYKEATFEELVGLRDTVKQIEHLAGLKNKLLKAARLRELDAALDEATASIEANSKGPRPRDVETRLPQDELLRAGAGFLASHRKMASLVREMDGFKDGGTLWELLIRPLNEAGTAEAVANEKATRELKAIFDAYGVGDIAKMYRKEFIPGARTSLTKMGQLMVALNWGNEDNRTKLMEGYGWSQAEVQAVLDRLDERDWKVVQAIWKHIDSYWAETEAMSKRVLGVAPPKVEPAQVVTKYGTFEGGYFPLKYDDRQEPMAYAHLAEEAAKRAMGAGTVRSTTKQGHRKARVEGVKMPVRLDFGVIFEHVAEVIHDQTHYETLIDMNKLLGNRRLQSSIIAHHGDQVYRQLTAAVNDVAAGNVPAQQSMERAINYLRVGTTISGLGWNLFTSLMQPLGLTQSVVRIGPKWVAKGMARVLGDAKRMENTAAWIQEKSEFMRMRGKTQQREINEVRNELRLRGKLSKVEDSYFWFIAKGQQLVDIPTWAGAYEKAMADADTDPDVRAMSAEDQDKRAVALADQAVLDSQGGGQVKDLAQVQRGGPLLKLWTNFYSFFNTTYNLAVESGKRTNWRKPADVGRFAVDMMMLYVAPAMLVLALREALKGNGGDDDDWLEKAIREQVAYMMGSLVLVREVAGAVQGFRGYEGPAGTRAFSEVGKLFKQLEQGELDEAALRALNNVAGILFHYPAGQVDRSVRGTAALLEGQAGPVAPLFGPPPNR